MFFFFNDTATTEIYTLSLHDALPIFFGLKLLESDEFEIPKEVLELAERRERARKSKDFVKSDELRDEILKRGFIVNDEKNGYVLERGERYIK